MINTSGMRALISLLFVATLSGCGGGSDGGGSSTPRQDDRLSGVFIDSPVQGMPYQTSSGSNEETDSQGRFFFLPDDTIIFMLGGITFPPVPGHSFITPFDLFGTNNQDDPRIINFIRLVQSLDDNGNINTTIRLTPNVINLVNKSGLKLSDFSRPVDEFPNIVPIQLIIAGIPHIDSLVSLDSAMQHFQVSLLSSKYIDIDEDGLGNFFDDDDDNDGIEDDDDAYPWDFTESQDSDADGIRNNADTDDDNDGLPDTSDSCITTDHNLSTDFDGDGCDDTDEDTDDDNDGATDTSDNCLTADHHLSADLDNDGCDDANEDTNVASGITTRLESLPAVADFQFDKHQPRVFVTHTLEKMMSVIDLQSGAVIKSISFSYMPERMALSQDGLKLYVALLVQPHSSYWWNANQSGYIAVINTETLEVENNFTINTDPYDLVVNGSGKLVVSSGSGQWTSIYAYNATTGAILGSAFIREASRLALHPSGNWVFSADTDLSPSDISKFDISGVGIVALGDSPYHGDYRMSGNVWATPDGQYVITRGGDLFLASNMIFVKSLTNFDIGIVDVSFDTDTRTAILSLTDKSVLILNLVSMESITNHTFPATVVASTSSASDNLAFYITDNSAIYDINKLYHPCLACLDNTVPIADFAYTSENGTTEDTYNFNASISTDTEDGSSLQYRWDINDDGVWDTGFTSTAQYSYRFIQAGTKKIRLQVKDSGGFVNSALKTFTVAQGIDSGIVIHGGNVLELPFAVTDVELDTLRSKAYITDKAAKRLYVVDLLTGVAEKYFTFTLMPERMTMTPDGSKLYVALLVQEHSSYWRKEDQSGYIAVLDLDQQAKVNTFAINTDPYDLVVNANGKLVVSSGSGQWTSIYAYNTSNGAVLGSASIRQASRLSLHPSGNAVFAADTDSSPSNIHKYDISGTGIISLGDSPYHGDYRMDGNVWVTPDGQYVITRGGDVFLASNMTFVASLTPAGVSINQIAFDETEKITFVAGSNGIIYYYNLISLELIEIVDGVTSANWILPLGNYIYVVIPALPSNYELLQLAHPCLGCGTNTPPVADFSNTPISGTTLDTYVFDASASSDTEDGSALQYRWDLDNNGVWDTAFNSSKTYSYQFILAGAKYVRLQVKDSGGLVHAVTKTINVEQGIDPGSAVTGSSSFELQFSITDIELDAARSKAYITDKGAKRLYVVDLATGYTEKYFTFNQMPERMTMTPDGSKLYVALLVQEHSSYWRKEDQSGYIAVLDLDQQAKVNTFAINTDPYDLVVNANGKLVVSSGSGQWTSIYAYNATTGAILGSAFIREASRLALHPSGNWVFSADTDLSPSDISKFDISGVGIVALGDSPYHGDYRMSGNVWATPDGQYVITRGGDVFLASNMTFVASLTPSGVMINDLAFDAVRKVVFIVGSNGTVYYFNITSLELIGTFDGISTARWVMSAGDTVSFTLAPSGPSSQLLQVSHPCLSCGINTTPQASFTYTPVTGTTEDTFVFDASASSDAEDGSILQYRWDLDNNGVWDTAFNSSKTYSYQFTLAGTKYVRLQVKDSGGLTHALTKSITVTQSVSFGTEITDGTAFEFPFTATDVEVDRLNFKAYITDKAAKRLYVVDLLTGVAEKYFTFTLMPERMTMAPDGSKLYVALLVQEHSSYWWEEDQSGYIAVFDLDQQAKVNTFAINTDPYDLVVNGSGKLVVSSGSGQWTSIYAYNASNGAVLGSTSIRQASRLSLHPSGNAVFAADTDSSPSDIRKYDISGTGITSLGDSSYHGDYRMSGNVWATPDGQYVITRGGDVFLASDITFVTSLTPPGVYINDLSFNVENQSMIIAGSNNITYRYDLITRALTGSNSSWSALQFVLEVPGTVYVLRNPTGSSLLNPVSLP